LCSILFSFYLVTPPPPTPTLFPYTTLFRSHRARRGEQSLFRGCRCSILFCATELERGRRSGGDQSGCLGGNARASVGSPRLLLRRKSTGWRQALCSHVGTRAGRRRRSCDRQRLCRARRGNGIEARFWGDGLSPFDPARRLHGAPKRNRSG